MKPKQEEVMTVTLQGGDYLFKFELVHTLFKGYEVVYTDAYNEYVGKDNFLMK